MNDTFISYLKMRLEIIRREEAEILQILNQIPKSTSFKPLKTEPEPIDESDDEKPEEPKKNLGKPGSKSNPIPKPEPMEPHMPPKILFYTDGNCTGNGTPSAVSGSGIYVADNHPYNQSCRVHGEQTNNRAECWAVIMALTDKNFPPGAEIEIRSDSEYAVNMANGSWKPKDNLDLIKPMKELVKRYKVKMTHIRRGSEIGNTKADLLAREAM